MPKTRGARNGRAEFVFARVTIEEKAQIKDRADAMTGGRVSDYIRETALGRPLRQLVNPGVFHDAASIARLIRQRYPNDKQLVELALDLMRRVGDPAR